MKDNRVTQVTKTKKALLIFKVVKILSTVSSLRDMAILIFPSLSPARIVKEIHRSLNYAKTTLIIRLVSVRH